ncbi:MAG: ABC transporter permease subunit [Bifidobacteriaceae bacterium]|jgi:D-methionine transport system permease protein|nr:ABC transporter permease subunit [Bifidobacteriaceae bacterium]
MNNYIIDASRAINWDTTLPKIYEATFQTLQMVFTTLLVGGILGLVFGIILWGTRKGNLIENFVVYKILSLTIDIIRPIPFIIFITAIQPLTIGIMGTSIGTTAVIFPMTIFATVATARLVEQSLIQTDPGIIEAGLSMGASRKRILFQLILPEAICPLILGYAFLLIAIFDMSAMAGTVGGGGLGNFAMVWGYQKFNPTLMWICVGIILVFVELTQIFAQYLTKRIIHKRS